MTWLRQLVEAQGDQDPTEFLESLKVDLFEDEVFVFTPKGEVKNLSAGSTPLDFAYAVHTDVGHRCVGAKVNGNIVPLHYQLRSGDIVEVLTAKQKRGPSRDWLKLVRTSRARNKIRAFFKEERREDAEKRGREALEETLRKRGIPMQKVAISPLLADVIREMGYRKATDFYIALGQGKISTKAVAKKVMQRLAGRRGGRGAQAVREHRDRRQGPADQGGLQLRDQGQGRRSGRGSPRQVLPAGPRRRDRRLRLARPRDHDPPHRLQEPEGAEAGAGTVRRGELERRERGLLPGPAPDRRLRPHPPPRGPLENLSEAGINIIEASCMTRHPMVKNTFVIEVGDPEQLKQCLSRLRNVESVFDAYRITPTS